MVNPAYTVILHISEHLCSTFVLLMAKLSLCWSVCLIRRNLNYFSSAYTAAVSAVDPDAGNGELVIKVPSELWKQGDGEMGVKVQWAVEALGL